MVMMAAMMLPSLVPMLMRYREAIGAAGETRLDRFTALAGAGYFLVWAGVGLAIYPIGMALAAIAMQQRALSRLVPIAAAAVVVVSAALQFTGWKAQQLAWCREGSARAFATPPGAGTALRHGIHLGDRCLRSCANLMAILLVLGMMDLRVMTVVTAAITLERLAPISRTSSYFERFDLPEVLRATAWRTSALNADSSTVSPS
jgi:predicted metal-binding membrane protein